MDSLGGIACELFLGYEVAQGNALDKIGRDVEENNVIMTQYIAPAKHMISSLMKKYGHLTKFDGETQAQLQEDLKKLNTFYKECRVKMMDAASDGAIQDGALEDLFPEDLTEITPYQLEKTLEELRGKLEGWRDHYKEMNSQKVQDLYLLIQIMTAILGTFQEMVKTASRSDEYKIHNQKPQ